jgi:hypothetical protein
VKGNERMDWGEPQKCWVRLSIRLCLSTFGRTLICLFSEELVFTKWFLMFWPVKVIVLASDTLGILTLKSKIFYKVILRGFRWSEIWSPGLLLSYKLGYYFLWNWSQVCVVKIYGDDIKSVLIPDSRFM